MFMPNFKQLAAGILFMSIGLLSVVKFVATQDPFFLLVVALAFVASSAQTIIYEPSDSPFIRQFRFITARLALLTWLGTIAYIFFGLLPSLELANSCNQNIGN